VPKTSIFAISALTLLLSGVAQAGTIGNGPPNQTGGSDLNAFLEGDNFVVASPGVHITQIQFWALASDPSDFTGSVDWAFYSDLGGLPNISVLSGSAPATGTLTGNTTFGLNEYSYTFGINAGLTPGAYWLVLHNRPPNAIPATSFYWAWSSDSGDSASLDLAGGPPWAGNSAELAFALTADPIPEPVSMSLVGGGILAAFVFGRRKAKGLKG
jgi:hypothetical protein